MKLSNEQYDFIKRILLPLLTGGATFVLTVGRLWNIPHTEQIAGTMTALATLISFVINSASKEYFSDKEIIGQDINNKEVGDKG